ncbi:MAG: presqualene diphosphate synthase HpnD [Cytophagales bacterium]|nr:presqualene diphosphate synthase HpnD [Cytophagales bacterium]
MSHASQPSHYENFPVASILCPKRLRPAVASLYWFARTADDLADEGDATPEQRLADLAAYRANLPQQLGAIIEAFQLPTHHLHELLDAFEKDVKDTAAGHRYQTRTELLAYCKLSANPIGRLMLHLFGVHDEESKQQSDAICTALQLINFWQDVSVDVPRGRFYVPPAHTESMQALCAWARGLMMAGSPLCKRVATLSSWRFGWELRLVVQGGLRILDKIEGQGFDTNVRRPKINKWDAPLIFWRALWMPSCSDVIAGMTTPQTYVQEKAAKSGSSFYYAFLFLPKPKRAAITAFYAFCREVDDAVDDAIDAGVAATKLAWWRKEVGDAFAGQAHHPVMLALMPALSQLGLSGIVRAEHLLQIIDGCEMDLTQTRYLDQANLARYCHLVAGVVGEVSAHIFGQTQTQTTNYAHTLGQALQLTNILRDVGEDARKGRIYLPVAELQKFDVKAHEILSALHSERFVALMRDQAAKAHQIYDTALLLLPAADKRAQKSGLMMAAIYRDLLREIEHSNFQVLNQRISLTPLRKFWLAWKVQAFG